MTRWKTWAVGIGMGSLVPAAALAQQGGTPENTQDQPGAPSGPAAPSGGRDSNQAMPSANTPQTDTGASKSLSMSDLPAPVQDTLKQQAQGNTISGIKQTKDVQGNTVFQAQIKKGRQAVDVQVAPDGTLIKKAPAHEGGEQAPSNP